MVRIVYKSVSLVPFFEPELKYLVILAKKRNANVGITGKLIYADGLFLQVLEGQEDVVEALYVRIEVDHRHADVQRLSKTMIQERTFGKWSMGLATASRAELIEFADRIASLTVSDDDSNVMEALRDR